MIVKTIKKDLMQYFKTLAVPDIFGRTKVTLILADEDGNALSEDSVIPYYENEEDAVHTNNNESKDYKLELDATSSINTVMSNKTLKSPAEGYKVFSDSAIRDPNRITIVANIDVSKLSVLEQFSNPENWMYIVHRKNMGGLSTEIGFYSNSKLYHIKTSSITDSGFKNTVKVQFEMEEVVKYLATLKYRFGVEQTNSVSGSGKSTSKGKVYPTTTFLQDTHLQGAWDWTNGEWGKGKDFLKHFKL